MTRTARAALLVLALLAPAGSAGAVGLGVEGFGGVSLPIAQGDSEQGTQFGARIPVVLPIVTLEPYYAATDLGNPSETFNGLSYERDGGDITAYGLNARFFGTPGPGLTFFPFVGFGSHTLKREGIDDRTEVGYNAGLGLEFSPLIKLGFSLRGEFNIIPTGETSRKFANITLGASYQLLGLP
jgi:hypothetical protein